jgi:membrane protease YdiL (CAAX protease family)
MRWTANRAARPYAALVACVAILAVWDVSVRPALPTDMHPVGGLIVAGCTVALGLWGGLDTSTLGLSPRQLRDGLRYGGLAFGAITAIVLIGLVLPPTREGFHSGRGDISAGELLTKVLITIPLGTVVVEELIFRGAVLGLLLRVLPTWRAALACSVLFGLWHLPSVVSDNNHATIEVIGAAVGTFAATFAGGMALCWLRIRSGSLLAPAMAHLATNTVALVVAWFVVH